MLWSLPYRQRYPGPDHVYNMKPELDGCSCCGMTFLHVCEKSGEQARLPSWLPKCNVCSAIDLFFYAVTPNASMLRSPPYWQRYHGPDHVYNMKPELENWMVVAAAAWLLLLHMCEKSSKQARLPSWLPKCNMCDQTPLSGISDILWPLVVPFAINGLTKAGQVVYYCFWLASTSSLLGHTVVLLHGPNQYESFCFVHFSTAPSWQYCLSYTLHKCIILFLALLWFFLKKNKSNRTNDTDTEKIMPMKRALCLLSSAMENVWSAFWKNFAGQPYCSSDTQKCKRSQKIHIVCRMMWHNIEQRIINYVHLHLLLPSHCGCSNFWTLRTTNYPRHQKQIGHTPTTDNDAVFPWFTGEESMCPLV
jgi:hypothetical protein